MNSRFLRGALYCARFRASGGDALRSEMQAVAEQIKEVVILLRRHL
jgi:hypothetical protein